LNQFLKLKDKDESNPQKFTNKGEKT